MPERKTDGGARGRVRGAYSLYRKDSFQPTRPCRPCRPCYPFFGVVRFHLLSFPLHTYFFSLLSFLFPLPCSPFYVPSSLRQRHRRTLFPSTPVSFVIRFFISVSIASVRVDSRRFARPPPPTRTALHLLYESLAAQGGKVDSRIDRIGFEQIICSFSSHGRFETRVIRKQRRARIGSERNGRCFFSSRRQGVSRPFNSPYIETNV